MLGQGRDSGWMMEEMRLWTTAFPAPSPGRLGKQEWRGRNIQLQARGQKKVFQKGFFFSFRCLSGGVSKKITMSHSSPTHTEQLIFLGRNSEARTAAISIAKGKTPAKHTYLFTVQEKQMDKERKGEKGERGKKDS